MCIRDRDYEIPAVMEKKRGFFDTREIGLMVSMLQVIDNPHQDIPLAAVLLGPMFSLTEDELAVIRMENRTADLYDAILTYDKSDALYEKLQHFLETLSYFRKKASYAAVGEIVQDIYDHTGIYEAVRLMPNGVQRNAKDVYKRQHPYGFCACVCLLLIYERHAAAMHSIFERRSLFVIALYFRRERQWKKHLAVQKNSKRRVRRCV